MNIIKKITWLLLSGTIGFVLAVSLFWLIVKVTMPPSSTIIQESSIHVVTDQIKPTNTKNSLNKESIAKHTKTKNCLEQTNNIDEKINCFNDIASKPIVEVNNAKQDSDIEPTKNCDLFYFCYLSDKLFIQIIYLLQFIALWVQTWIISYILLNILFKITNKYIGNFLGSASRWAIDSPPVIGVVGTLYAFAYAANIASMDGGIKQLTEVFKMAFNDAALTTMIGGIIYVINLALNIIKDSNVEV